MRFSLVITTRLRVQMLTDLLDSIYRTTKNKDSVEIHINHDDDDKETSNASESIVLKYPEIKIYFHSRPRSEFLIRDFVNWSIGSFANGKYILPLNDDTVFQTQDWDEKAWNKLEDYLKDKPDGVVYGNTEDNEPTKAQHSPETGGQFTCFPLISKKAFDAMEGYGDPDLRSWGADVHLYSVYSKVQRICDLKEEINIFHISVHSGRRGEDEVFSQMAGNCRGRSYPFTNVDRDVDKILRYINSFKKE